MRYRITIEFETDAPRPAVNKAAMDAADKMGAQTKGKIVYVSTEHAPERTTKVVLARE